MGFPYLTGFKLGNKITIKRKSYVEQQYSHLYSATEKSNKKLILKTLEVYEWKQNKSKSKKRRQKYGGTLKTNFIVFF